MLNQEEFIFVKGEPNTSDVPYITKKVKIEKNFNEVNIKQEELHIKDEIPVMHNIFHDNDQDVEQNKENIPPSNPNKNLSSFGVSKEKRTYKTVQKHRLATRNKENQFRTRVCKLKTSNEANIKQEELHIKEEIPVIHNTFNDNDQDVEQNKENILPSNPNKNLSGFGVSKEKRTYKTVQKHRLATRNKENQFGSRVCELKTFNETNIKQEELHIKEEIPVIHNTFNDNDEDVEQNKENILPSNPNKNLSGFGVSKEKCTYKTVQKHRLATRNKENQFGSRICELKTFNETNIKQEELHIKEEIPVIHNTFNDNDEDVEQNKENILPSNPNKNLSGFGVSKEKCTYKTVQKHHLATRNKENQFGRRVFELKTFNETNIKQEELHIKEEIPVIHNTFNDNDEDVKQNKENILPSNPNKNLSGLAKEKRTYKTAREHCLATHNKENQFGSRVCEFRTHNKSCDCRKIHTGGKSFTCHLCEFTTAQQSCLTVHMRIHTGNSPYACNLCNYITRKKTDLRKHIKVHYKPY